MDNTENKTLEFQRDAHAFLTLIEHKFFMTMTSEVLGVLEKPNDLTDEQRQFWAAIGKDHLEMFKVWQKNLEVLKDAYEIQNKADTAYLN